LKAEKL